MKTQRSEIAKYLVKVRHSITSAEAVDKFGCYRLSARIQELKDMGFSITMTVKSSPNRYGYNSNFAEYRMANTNHNRNLYREIYESTRTPDKLNA